MVNKRVWNAVLGCNLKNDRMISIHFQGKPFNITVIQVYAPTNNAEEAEVERFYEDLQDLLELTPPKSPFHFMPKLTSHFLQFKSEFSNKEFMIWATVSSWSFLCWLYRASPSLAAKNIINLISVLTIWWCPCVESSLVLLEEGVCYDQCVLLANSISLHPASFHTPRPNLPVIPGVSWLRTFVFQSLIMKRTSF